MKTIVSWSGGKDSTATVILAHQYNLPIDLIIFSEVMFDKNISGELPEHIDFVKNKCIPVFESWGYKVKILHSDLTYMDFFNREPIRGKRLGSGLITGFPMSGRCCINRSCKVLPIKNFFKSINEDMIQYIGIAIDEPKRLARLKKNQISLLAELGYTEQMAFDLDREYNLLSPIYEFSSRGGCWFCPNARSCELKHLRNEHRDLWDTLLMLEEIPNLIGNKWNTLTQTSIHDLEKKYDLEDSSFSLFDFI